MNEYTYTVVTKGKTNEEVNRMVAELYGLWVHSGPDGKVVPDFCGKGHAIYTLLQLAKERRMLMAVLYEYSKITETSTVPPEHSNRAWAVAALRGFESRQGGRSPENWYRVYA